MHWYDYTPLARPSQGAHHCSKNGMKASAFGEHCKEEHPHTAPDITFEVIKHAADVLQLQIEEAMAIQRYNPALNRKIEQLGTGYLP